MKVAYLGRSPVALKTLRALKPIFTEIDYYLMSEDESLSSLQAFNRLAVLTDRYYLSTREDELTPGQINSFKNIETQYDYFKKLIFGSVLNEEENEQQLSENQTKVQIKKLQSPFSITYSGDEKKYRVVTENQSAQYDFIMTENTGHKGFCPLKNDPFTFFDQKYCFYNIEYSYAKKSPSLDCFDVLRVDSENLKDVNDNWSIVHVMKNCVRVVVPVLYAQIDNQDYIDYIKSRTFEKFSTEFPALNLETTIREYSIPANENFEQIRSSFSSPQIILMPDLTYWTSAQVERFVQDSFSAGKYRSFFKSKETTL